VIPVADPRRGYLACRDEVDAAIARVLEAGRFVLGDEVAAFEAEFAAYCGSRYAVATGSGTDALRLSLIAAGVRPGDEVMVPAFTAVPTLAAVVAAGAVPVPADVDPVTCTLDVERAAARVGPRTRAVIPVHLYGQPAEMAPLMDLAERHGLAVIEDACQAHGARYGGRRAGAMGHAGCFSFYPTKNLGALGDGGMVVTDDAGLADRVRSLRNLGQRERFQHVEAAGHSRLDEIQAAVLRAKLPHLDRWNARRREIAAAYTAALADSPAVPPSEAPDAEHCFHLYVIQVDGRDGVQDRLRAAGVGSDVHYPVPVHLQPGYRYLGYRSGDFPASERLAARVLSLPMYPELTDEEVQTVARAVRAAVEGVSQPGRR
jgi:dTDP-4-amino-4,6-dideoxygalactose transaminase